MRNYNYICSFLSSILLLSMGSVYAQNTAPVSANNTDSFADIATLGEEIAIAKRKMEAMTLKNSLEALEAQQNMGTFPYKVLRVEGFNDTLYAVLSDDSGIVYQVGPGDLVGNQYRVSLIRPTSVGVFDINTRKTYAVPFVIGGAGALINDFSQSMPPAPSMPQTSITHNTTTS